MLKVLELFCGIGGFAAATRGRAEVIQAIDLSEHVLQVYKHNFPTHMTRQIGLDRVRPEVLNAGDPDMWWMSPPCQPYTVRGVKQDLDDPRAVSLIHLLGLLRDGLVTPTTIAMENVEGFLESRAHELLFETLDAAGYTHRVERVLCPTELGVPARRLRYYLVASREPLLPAPPPARYTAPLADYLDAGEPDEALIVPAEDVAKHGPGMRIFDVAQPGLELNCFTSAYGKTFRCAGSYIQLADGRVRRYSPDEILRLMCFPEWYSFPEGMTLRMRYKHIGNSLSIAAMREILRVVPTLEEDR
jgi:DNA (cytosine-5)-methyltransferase 1